MSVDGIGPRIGSANPAIAGPKARPEPKPTAATDPGLRSILSPDELAYFAEIERMGPVTYGPKNAVRTDAPPPVLGQRIDVRA